MALIEDLKTKKYFYGALAIFTLVAGYFAVNAGLIGLVGKVFGVVFGSAPVTP